MIFLLIIVLLGVLLIIDFIVTKRGKSKKSSEQNSGPTVKTSLPSSILSDSVKQNELEKEKLDWINSQLETLYEYNSILDLIKLQPTLSITYSDLLNCFEWKAKRLKVLLRDKYECQDCHSVSLSNHVHHTYYIKNKLPWEISTSTLLTLCEKCHFDRHQKEKIEVYELINGEKQLASYLNIYCSRCNGAGYFPQFSHVEFGICFNCRGNIVNRTVFSTRISEIIENPSEYNLSFLMKELDSFLSKTSNESYKEISGMLNRYPFVPTYSRIHNNSEDDLPF